MARLASTTVGVADAALAEQIRGDEIDILVDLSGHSAGNRLAVFARKPAPVQVTAWGYATGTGLATMDCFLAEKISDRVMALWGRILAEVPNARLLIKDQRLDAASAREFPSFGHGGKRPDASRSK